MISSEAIYSDVCWFFVQSEVIHIDINSYIDWHIAIAHRHTTAHGGDGDGKDDDDNSDDCDYFFYGIIFIGSDEVEERHLFSIWFSSFS